MDRPVETAIFIALIVLALVLWVLGGRYAARDGEWHPMPGYRFRRWRNGKWEYKDMTHEEAEQHQLDKAL